VKEGRLSLPTLVQRDKQTLYQHIAEVKTNQRWLLQLH